MKFLCLFLCHFFLTVMDRATHKASFEQAGKSFKKPSFKSYLNPFTTSLAFGICCSFVCFVLQTHLS